MAKAEIEVDSKLVRLCIEAACESSESVDRWRRQRRTLERLPFPLAEALLHRLLHRRLLYPSLLEIFKYSVENIDFSDEQLVDAEWIAYIGAFSYLHSLNLADCHKLTSSSLWPITGLANLKEIDLSRCIRFTDSGINLLLSIPHLEKLNISQTGVSNDGIKLVSSLENLKHLDLGGLHVSDLVLNSLLGLTRLEYLDLWGSYISNKGILILKKFQNLKHLGLAWTSITMFPNLVNLECLDLSNCTIDSILEETGDLSSLRKLILHGSCFKISTELFSSIDPNFLTSLDVSNTALNHISFRHPMPALEHLNLSDSKVLDVSLEEIAKAAVNLRHLNLNNTKITSAGVAMLVGHVPKLESLSLSHTAIDDDVIVYISMMSQLQAVDLSGTNIRGLSYQTEEEVDEILSLAELKNLKQLKNLDLSGTLIADSELSPLSSLQALACLSLKNASLTDNCLVHLESIKSLVDLSIKDALLMDDGLNSFNPPPKLRCLDLRGCWLLTRNAITLYCQNHPHIQVRHEHAWHSRTKKEKKGQMASWSPSPSKIDLLDQRIKYSMAQLLSLEHSTSALSNFTISADINDLITGPINES